MTRREAHDATDPRLAFGDQQSLAPDIEPLSRGVGPEGSEVVVEDQGTGVGGVPGATGPHISRTEITARVVIRLSPDRHLLDLALPGTERPVRRHHHPLVAEGVEPAMRVVI
jgi:hypothetical protein